MRNSATLEQYELPAMPAKTSKLAKALRSAKEDLEEFQRLSDLHGGLIPKSMAARLCGVSPQRIYELVGQGRLQNIECVGNSWLSGDEVKSFMLAERKAGRPWPVPSMVGMLKDAYKGIGK